MIKLREENKMFKITTLISEGRFKGTHRTNAYLTIESIPHIMYWPRLADYAFESSNFEEVNKRFDVMFKIDWRYLVACFISKCHVGKDRKGYYLIGHGDVFMWKKRPTRHRPNKHVLDVMVEMINNNFKFEFKKPELLYMCNGCGKEAYKDGWQWSYTVGLANSDYISKCNSCGLERGDFFGNISNKMNNVRQLEISQRWDNGAQFCWSIDNPTITIHEDVCNKLYLETFNK